MHLVMVRSDTEEHQAQLKRAEEALAEQGMEIHLGIRQFLVGSTATRILETAKKPLVILR